MDLKLIVKTWKRCKSIGRSSNNQQGRKMAVKSRSWPRMVEEERETEERRKRKAVVPEGCFSVYVGEERQRFVIKTEYVNHPLFKLLLEEAESEFGFHSDGPLVLPCNVDVFCSVLSVLEGDKDGEVGGRKGCGFGVKSSGSYRLLSAS